MYISFLYHSSHDNIYITYNEREKEMNFYNVLQEVIFVFVHIFFGGMILKKSKLKKGEGKKRSFSHTQMRIE